MANPSLTQKTTVLLESEVTYGTDPTPTGADALEVWDFQPRNDSETRQRMIYRASLSKSGEDVTTEILSATFKVELKPDSNIKDNDGSLVSDPTNVAKIVKVFRMMGFSPEWVAETSPPGSNDGYVGLQPSSTWPHAEYGSIAGSATIYFNLDGVKYIMKGCWANGSIVIEAGEYPVLEVEVMGIYGGVSDETTLPTIVLDSNVPAVAASDTMSFGAYTTPVMRSLRYDINNTINRRMSVLSGQGGLKGFWIADRDIGGTVTVEMETEGTNAWFGDGQDSTQESWTWVHNDVTDNGVQINTPKTQYLANWTDVDGIRQYELNFRANANSDVGDDEMTITLGNLP